MLRRFLSTASAFYPSKKPIPMSSNPLLKPCKLALIQLKTGSYCTFRILLTTNHQLQGAIKPQTSLVPPKRSRSLQRPAPTSSSFRNVSTPHMGRNISRTTRSLCPSSPTPHRPTKPYHLATTTSPPSPPPTKSTSSPAPSRSLTRKRKSSTTPR